MAGLGWAWDGAYGWEDMGVLCMPLCICITDGTMHAHRHCPPTTWRQTTRRQRGMVTYNRDGDNTAMSATSDNGVAVVVVTIISTMSSAEYIHHTAQTRMRCTMENTDSKDLTRSHRWTQDRRSPSTCKSDWHVDLPCPNAMAAVTGPPTRGGMFRR